MKIAVTSFFDKNSTDEYKKLSEICSQINKKYCQLNNYSYFINEYNNNVIQQLNQDFSNPEKRLYLDNILICKFLSIKKYLKDFDYVLFLDPDAVFVNPNIKIQQFIDNQHDIYFSRGNNKLQNIIDIKNIITIFENIFHFENIQPWIENFYQQCQKFKEQYNFDILRKFIDIGINSYRITGGIFIFKNSQYGNKILNQCINHYELFTNLQSSAEQSALGYFILKDPLKAKLLPDICQTHINGGQNAKYNENTSFIMHNYGLYKNIDKKIQLINLVKYNKWWKDYFKNE